MEDKNADVKVWHDPPAGANVDICFIHGLGGHRDNTWTAKSKNAKGPWPPKLLPTELPRARLLTYGYDSRVVKLGTSPTDTIRCFSNSLLHSLTRVRTATDSLRRPIIFVVHSLGGLVCKRATTLSKQRNDAHGHNCLVESLVGIVFMGTPHRGSSIADAAGLLLFGMLPFKSSNRGLLKSLARDNQTAQDIEDDFWDAVNAISTDSQKGIQIYCFHETKARFPLRSCIVAQNSATYPHRPYDKIDADHSKMVKFESPEEAGFKNLCHVLSVFLKSDRLQSIVAVDAPLVADVPTIPPLLASPLVESPPIETPPLASPPLPPPTVASPPVESLSSSSLPIELSSVESPPVEPPLVASSPAAAPTHSSPHPDSSSNGSVPVASPAIVSPPPALPRTTPFSPTPPAIASPYLVSFSSASVSSPPASSSPPPSPFVSHSLVLPPPVSPAMTSHPLMSSAMASDSVAPSCLSSLPVISPPPASFGALNSIVLYPFPSHSLLPYPASLSTIASSTADEGRNNALAISVQDPLLYSQGGQHRETEMQMASVRRFSLQKTRHLILPFGKNRNFVGRESLLGHLQDLLFGKECAIVALYGLGGAGKTQVANALAHLVKKQRPDYSVFWVPALSMATFKEAYQAIATTLGIPHGDIQDIRAVVQQHLSSEESGNWLLILDSADDFDLVSGQDNPDNPDTLQSFLPQSDCGRILVTTRMERVAEALAEESVPLQEMVLEEAREIATKLLRRKRDIETDGGRESLDELLRELVFLPLAIAQAVAYMNQTGLPPKGYLQLLRSTEADRFHLLSRESPDKTRYKESRHAIATTWLASLAQLQRHSPKAVSLLEFISQIQPRDIPLEMLPVKGSRVDLLNIVSELAAYSFVSIQDGEKLDMHGLVHMAARNWVRQNRDVKKVTARVVRHLWDFTKTFSPNDEYHSRAYLPHLMYVLDKNTDVGSVDTLKLYFTAALYINFGGHYAESLRYAETAVRWARSNLPEDHPSRLDAEFVLADIVAKTDLESRAIPLLENIVRVRAAVSDVDLSLLRYQITLVYRYIESKRFSKALELLDHIHSKWDVFPDGPILARLRAYRAVALRETGKVSDAICILEEVARSQETLEAIDATRQYADRELAASYEAAGKREDAVAIYKGIAARYSALSDDSLQRLRQYFQLGCAYLRSGNVEDAIGVLEDCAAKLRTRKPFRVTLLIDIEYHLAKWYFARCDTKKAINLMEEVVENAQKLPVNCSDRKKYTKDLENMKECRRGGIASIALE